MSYIYQIINIMWPLMIKFCTLKLVSIFLFVIILTTAFIVIMYKDQKNELKKYIIDGQKVLDDSQTISICNSVHSQLQNLAVNLLEKEEQLIKSRSDLICAEKVLDFIENNKISSVNRYKKLLSGLKDDLEKIESEVSDLQIEITGLSKQRENLKIDVLKQQEDYKKLFDTFTKEFDIENESGVLNSVLKFDTPTYNYKLSSKNYTESTESTTC